MLALTRRVGEKILIGDEIVIIVTSASGGAQKAGIGIEAPSEIAVHREEIYKRIEKQKNQKKT